MKNIDTGHDIEHLTTSSRPGREPCRGISADDDGAGFQWVMFHEPLDGEEAIERSGFLPALYYGPGQRFWREPCAWSTKRRTLVTQEFGWDI